MLYSKVKRNMACKQIIEYFKKAEKKKDFEVGEFYKRNYIENHLRKIERSGVYNPTALTYNQWNCGMSFICPLFEIVSRGRYKYLGINADYDGETIHKQQGYEERVIGYWTNGVFKFKHEDVRSLDEYKYKHCTKRDTKELKPKGKQTLINMEKPIDKNTFLNYYNSIKSEFEKHNKIISLEPKLERIHWPNARGVYAIWNKVTSELLYVGLAGKFKRNNEGVIEYNKANFRLRRDRWTPYRFCEHKNDTTFRYHFRYGPKYASVQAQGEVKFHDDAYSNSIIYTDLRIDCFTIDINHETQTPASLEANLLTSYLKAMNTLPPGNNSL